MVDCVQVVLADAAGEPEGHFPAICIHFHVGVHRVRVRDGQVTRLIIGRRRGRDAFGHNERVAATV